MSVLQHYERITIIDNSPIRLDVWTVLKELLEERPAAKQELIVEKVVSRYRILRIFRTFFHFVLCKCVD